jgi:effector-binding domain-containing protein
MGYTVTILKTEPQWIAAARGPLVKGQVAATMLALLGQAWGMVRKSGIKTDGQSVAIYRSDMIEAGPRLLEKINDCVATPSGLAVMTIHMGPYELLGNAHGAIREWCAANGHALEGTNWEVYGHHEEDPARRRTDVFYLLRS